MRHIENRFRHILFYFLFFLNAFWALTSGSFRIVSDTLVYTRCTEIFSGVQQSTSKYQRSDDMHGSFKHAAVFNNVNHTSLSIVVCALLHARNHLIS